MCGIVAIVGPNIDARQLFSASQSIEHRGPDADGVWVSRRNQCGLASRRLSLNDLAGGNQPLSTQSGRIAAVVNGEFYDFKAIRAGLEKKGHKFATRSDSEILLPLFIEYGEQCLTHLRGEFAFALWDEATQSLFAARDRFGIKPLFYGWIGQTLILASEAKALFAAGMTAQWDSQKFVDHMLLCNGPSGSMFRGIHQLPPGHYLKFSNGQLSIRRYWDIDFPRSGDDPGYGSINEAVESLRTQLDIAVRHRLDADVPVGAFLSGGLDSAAVVGLANASGARPTSFTVAFDEAEYDESQVAARTAKFNNVPNVPITMSFKALADSWERMAWHAETTFDNARGMARLLQCDAVRANGFKAVVSGEGADEVLAGYFFARQDYLRSLGPGSERDMIERGAGNTPLVFQSAIAGQKIGAIGASEAALGFTPSWLYGALSNRGNVMRSLIRPEFLSQSSNDDVVERLFADLGGFDGLQERHPVHQSLYLWIKTFLPNMILVIDRLEMAAAIESRVPFLDHHFVEAVQNIPLPHLFNGGIEKFPLRAAVADVIPDEIFSRSKQPFTAPHALRAGDNAMRDFIGDTVHSDALENCAIIEPAAARSLFNHCIQSEETIGLATDQSLMLLTNVALLQKGFAPTL